MKKEFLIAIIIVGVILGGLFLYKPGTRPIMTDAAQSTLNPDGSQTITITAKGGFSPGLVRAKTGIPTTLRMITQDTYDCSVSLVIPKLNYRKFMQSTGTEDIQISPEKATGTINGLCSMGMYSFKIIFE